MLASLRLTEADALQHSPGWLRDAYRAVAREEKAQMRARLQESFVATHAAHHGGEAFEQFQEYASLLSDDDAPAGPAQADLDDLRELASLGIGIHERMKVTHA